MGLPYYFPVCLNLNILREFVAKYLENQHIFIISQSWMSFMMITRIFEDFNKVKSHHLASNSNLIFKMWAKFKEKIMEIEYLIPYLSEYLKG